jgi:hypothetical protein
MKALFGFAILATITYLSFVNWPAAVIVCLVLIVIKIGNG